MERQQRRLMYRRARWQDRPGKPADHLEALLREAHLELDTLEHRKWDEVVDGDGMVQMCAASTELRTSPDHGHSWYRLRRWKPRGRDRSPGEDAARPSSSPETFQAPSDEEFTPSDALLCVHRNNVTLVARRFSERRIASYLTYLLRKAGRARDVDHLELDRPDPTDPHERIQRYGVTQLKLPVTFTAGRGLDLEPGDEATGVLPSLVGGAAGVMRALLCEDEAEEMVAERETPARAELVFFRPRSRDTHRLREGRDLLARMAARALDEELPDCRIVLGKGGGTITSRAINLTMRATLSVEAETVCPSSGWAALSEFMVRLEEDGDLI